VGRAAGGHLHPSGALVNRLIFRPMDYTTLSFAEIDTALQKVARDARTTFGALDAGQMNWRPDATRWSVAQCFLHLVTANRLMLQEARAALSGPKRSAWNLLPFLPRMIGPALIRSQAPTTTRKYKAPQSAQPTMSDIPSDVLEQFITQHRELAEWIRTVDEQAATRAIMNSPFIRFVAYSVLDGSRLLVAHDHRHFEQARRLTQLPEFPRR
jgi:hypothetical protein